MNVLGLSGFFHHDGAAALLKDGVLVAAAEEERFSRVKHAPGQPPLAAARFCLDRAGLAPAEVDLLAVSFSPDHYRAMRRPHLARLGLSPRALKSVLLRGRHRLAKVRRRAARLADDLGVEAPVHWVSHHQAHGASAFLFSGYETAAVFTADGQGELDAGLLGRAGPEGLDVVHRILLPDSLGMFYSSVTQFLGFRPNNGEYKVMGMAAYGDPGREDLSEFLTLSGGNPRVNERHCGLSLRVGEGRRLFSDRFVERWGPPRSEGRLEAPDTDLAAAAQDLLERAALVLARSRLGPTLSETGRLCLAGGVALNVKMNRALADTLSLSEVFVFPAAHDAGCAAGAAAAALWARGERPAPLAHAFLGPAFDRAACAAALKGAGLPAEEPTDLAGAVAEDVAAGRVAGFFQGAMEFGPRALGNRSILAHPGLPGTADRVNRAVKFREPWRPFCPSLLRSALRDVTGRDEDAPYMTLAFPVRPPWREALSQVVHVDATTRPQTVDGSRHPLLHRVLLAFQEKTGLPALLNTSLNRRGEPLACSPEDAVRIFKESGLDVLFLGPFRTSKVSP